MPVQLTLWYEIMLGDHTNRTPGALHHWPLGGIRHFLFCGDKVTVLKTMLQTSWSVSLETVDKAIGISIDRTLVNTLLLP